MPKISIKYKISILVIFVIALFGTLASYAIYNGGKEALLDQKEQAIELSLYNETNNLQTVFENASNTSKNISRDRFIIDFLENRQNYLTDQNSAKYISNYKTTELFEVLYVIDSTGRTQISTEPSFLQQNYGFRDYFVNSKQYGKYAQMAIGSTSGKPGFYFASAIYSDSREFIGVAVIKLDYEAINAHLIDINSSEFNKNQTEFMIVSQEGIIITSSSNEFLYKSLGKKEGGLNEQESNSLNRKFPEIEISALDYDEIYSELTSIDRIRVYYKNREKREILAISKMGDLPFYVLAKTNESNIDKELSALALRGSGLISISAALAMIIIIASTWLVLRPLGTIKNNVRRIAMGEYDFRFNIKTHDELEDLADTYNKMAAKLEKTSKETTTKFDRQKAKLEKMNNFLVGREIKLKELKSELEKYKDKDKGKDK